MTAVLNTLIIKAHSSFSKFMMKNCFIALASGPLKGSKFAKSPVYFKSAMYRSKYELLRFVTDFILVVHVTYFSSVNEIRSTEWAIRRSKQGICNHWVYSMIDRLIDSKMQIYQ